MDLGFKNVHVLVTGASGGIGSVATKLFLEHGAFVTAQYNSKEGPLTDMKKQTDKLQTVQADVTKENAVKNLFEEAGRFFQQEVQVLAVNHGISSSTKDMVDMELSQWQHCMDVNLTASFLLARELLRCLRDPRPNYKPDMSKVAVVVTGSTCGVQGGEGHIDYASASSARQIGFIRTLKNEIVKVAPEGRVNAISPGWVSTSMADPLFADKKLYKRILAATPLNRIATPEDVANQILMIASSTASRHLTGTDTLLDGGL